MGNEPEKPAASLVFFELLAYAARWDSGGILPVGHGFTRSRRDGEFSHERLGATTKKLSSHPKQPNMLTRQQRGKGSVCNIYRQKAQRGRSHKRLPVTIPALPDTGARPLSR